jgi:hypothetical protein
MNQEDTRYLDFILESKNSDNLFASKKQPKGIVWRSETQGTRNLGRNAAKRAEKSQSKNA